MPIETCKRVNISCNYHLVVVVMAVVEAVVVVVFLVTCWLTDRSSSFTAASGFES